jgi:hypothetical protein
VVDFAANTPLAGVPIAIAAYTPGAAPTPVATTNPNGQFTFSAAPGTYLLVIGSNTPISPTDMTTGTTTLHTMITLLAGANALGLPIPAAPANVTLTPSQTSGNFRLTALAGDQLSCFSGANEGRMQDSLPLLIPDESLTEYSVALAQEESAQNTDTPSPLTPGSLPFLNSLGGNGFSGTTSANFPTCTSWAGPSYSYQMMNPPFPFATDVTNIWYGAQRSGGTTVYGAQLWTPDPR